MTTEEKAKAYDEALERAKANYELNKTMGFLNTSDIIANIFPELRESEDERIRKAILGLTYLDGIEPILTKCSITAGDIRAYLEKQKEQPPYWNPTEEDVALFNKAVTTNKSLSPQDRAKLDIIRMKFKHCPYIEQKPEYPLTPDECIKPVEWSEEDERMLSRCVKSIETSKQFAGSDTFKKAKDKEISWLKDLLNRFNIQPKQEWSEEDKNVIETLIRELRLNAQFEFAVIKLGLDYVQTLTVLDKCRRLYPRPSWKPSEEQMNCLCAAIDAAIRKHNESISGYKPARVLKSLYEQLKKLM